MYIEVESDRDVLIDGIGLLEAGIPVVITDAQKHYFSVLQHTDLVKANFPPFVKVTAVVDSEKEGE